MAATCDAATAQDKFCRQSVPRGSRPSGDNQAPSTKASVLSLDLSDDSLCSKTDRKRPRLVFREVWSPSRKHHPARLIVFRRQEQKCPASLVIAFHEASVGANAFHSRPLTYASRLKLDRRSVLGTVAKRAERTVRQTNANLTTLSFMRYGTEGGDMPFCKGMYARQAGDSWLPRTNPPQ